MRKLCSLLLIFAVLLTLPCVSAEVYSGSETSGMACGDSLSWAVDGSTLYITGTGDMYNFSDTTPWASYRTSITRLVISDGVTYIGANAFKDFDALTDVEFGNSVTWLGERSFYSCDGLTSLVMPVSFKRFGAACLQSCPNLKAVYCKGGFPSFNDGCLWNDYVNVYYPSNNPWNDYYVQQLIANFHGRLDLIPYDMSALPSSGAPSAVNTPAPTQPAEQPAATTPTEAPLNAPIVFDRPAPTLETMPAQTLPPQTEPVQTVPPTTVPVQTAPPETVPPTTEAPTTAPAAAPASEDTFQLPTRSTQPTEPYRATDGSSIFGILIIVVTLLLLAVGTLIFQLSNRKRHRRRRRR